MVLVPVKSSQIKAIGYDACDRTMEIEFRTKAERSVYRYENVAPETIAEIVFADSIGAAFGKGVKADPAAFPFRRLTDVEAKNAVVGNAFDVDWIDALDPFKSGRPFGGKA